MSVVALDEKKYGRLLVRTLPKPISTEEEYDEVVALAGELMAKGEKALSPEEGKLLELLGLLIEDYDDRHYPPAPGDPITVLTELMDTRGLTQKDLWPLFGSKGTASEVLNRKRGISKAQAKRLAALFHVPADLFL